MMANKKLMIVLTISIVLVIITIYVVVPKGQLRALADEYRPRYLTVLYDPATGEILGYSASTSMLTICPSPYESSHRSYALAYYLLPEDLRSHSTINQLNKNGGLRVDPATANLLIGNHVVKPLKHLSPSEAHQKCSEVPPPYRK